MIPLIALFICFLAIAGVGIAYAYNSSIQIDDNPVNEQYFTLDYTNDGGNWIATVLPADAEDMTITTSVSVVETDTDPDTPGERTFNATINKVESGPNTAQLTREFYVKLTSNMDGQKFKITGEVKDNDDTVIRAIFGESTFKFYKGTGFTEEVTAGQFTASQDGVMYKVVLTVPINANVNVKSLDLANGKDKIVDAGTLATALKDLDNHKFSVKLTATPFEPVTP